VLGQKIDFVTIQGDANCDGCCHFLEEVKRTQEGTVRALVSLAAGPLAWNMAEISEETSASPASAATMSDEALAPSRAERVAEAKKIYMPSESAESDEKLIEMGTRVLFGMRAATWDDAFNIKLRTFAVAREILTIHARALDTLAAELLSVGTVSGNFVEQVAAEGERRTGWTKYRRVGVSKFVLIAPLAARMAAEATDGTSADEYAARLAACILEIDGTR
jgi:hypothetical protein